MRLLHALLVLLALSCAASASAQTELSPTRQLRRITLRLLGRTPTIDEYEALLAVPATGRASYLDTRVDAMLTSPEFQANLVDWGMEYLNVAAPFNDGEPYFRYPMLVDLSQCATGTLHAGRWRFGSEDAAICADGSAAIATVDAWWGASVELVGQATGTATTRVGTDGVTRYCGATFFGGSVYNVQTNREARDAGCGCGPNAIYCARTGTPAFGPFPSGMPWEGAMRRTGAMRRSIMEEPARLLAHIVMNDRPFSDLVVGNYSVADVGLFAYYRSNARHQEVGRYPERDTETWFSQFTSPTEWREVPISSMHPYLIDDRDYRFDPRTTSEEPLGIPSAGVLTMIGANDAFARERVRAARWLEIFACREFTPPPATSIFVPYRRDPATEGSCTHCHTLIDPAATFFKRQTAQFSFVTGIGNYNLSRLVSYDEVRLHREAAFTHDTLLTPLTEAQITANTNARLIDFLSGGTTLLGQAGDGTIGPLGFGKVVVASGEFDTCAVRQTYNRFGGRELDPGRDAALIARLSSDFVSNGRSLRRLIRAIVSSDEARLGN